MSEPTPQESAEEVLLQEYEEMKDVFTKLAGDKQLVSFADLLEWEEIRIQLDDGVLTRETCESVWNSMRKEEEGLLDLEGFLMFLEQVENYEDQRLEDMGVARESMVSFGERRRVTSNFGDFNPNDDVVKGITLKKIESMDSAGNDAIVPGHRDEAPIRAAGMSNLRSALLHHLRQRPERADLQNNGIIRDVASDMEQKVAKLQLARKLASRPDVEELERRQIMTGRATALATAMDHKMAGAMLNKALTHREEREALQARGVLRDELTNASALERNLNANSLQRSLERRPSREGLVDRNILRDSSAASAAAVTLEHSLTKNAVSHQLAHRPDREDLEHRGILLEGNQAQAALGKALRRDSLSRSLSQRPTREALEAKGLLEADQLAVLFQELAGEGAASLTAAALLAWPPLAERIESKDVSKQTFYRLFREAGGNSPSLGGGNGVTFGQFLLFLDLYEDAVLAASLRTSVVMQLPPDVEPRPVESTAHLISEATAEGEPVDDAPLSASSMTVKQVLLAHLQSRPELDRVLGQNIRGRLDSRDAAAGAALERSLARSQLYHNLERRMSRSELINRGIVKETTAAGTQLEMQLKRNAVSASLEHRPAREELEARGVVRSDLGNPNLQATAALQRNLNKDAVSRALDTRPDQEELVARNILKPQTAAVAGMHRTSMSVLVNFNVEMNKTRLNRALEQRQTPEQLQDQGIMLNHTPTSKVMERNLAAMQVSAGLKNRSASSDLTERGILPPAAAADGAAAAAGAAE